MTGPEEERVEGEEHPRGALVFILIYLVRHRVVLDQHLPPPLDEGLTP